MAKAKKITAYIVSLIILVAALGISVYYIVGPAAAEFHADCSDTLYWANASYESGKTVSDTFFYSALLPFGGQLIMLPLIGIFGFSLTAHTVGMIIFTVIFAAALYFMFRSLGMSLPASFGSVGVMLMIFSVSKKMREMFYGHVIYYSLGILFFALLIGAVLRLISYAENKKPIALISVMAVVTAILGAGIATDGLQVIVLSTAPVIFALFIDTILDGDKKLISKENIPAGLSLLILAVSTVIGMAVMKAISSGVIAGYAEGYSTYDSMGDWIENLLSFPQKYFSLIGVSVIQNDPLFDFNSVINILRIAFSIIVLIIPVFGAVKYRSIRHRSVRIITVAHFFVSAFVLFGFVFGKLAAANWRIIPMYGTAVLASLAILWELFSHGIVGKRVSCLLLVFILAVGVIAGAETVCLPSKSEDNAHLYELSEYLTENGLSYGYADYWEAQAISVIEGPDIKVRGIRVRDSGDIEMYPYQTDSLWYGVQSEEYFVILDSSDKMKYLRSLSYVNAADYLVSSDSVGSYTVFVFSADPLPAE
ncbi:MAG: hypothetical protein IKV54_04865 [Clostridia bacterium]|nr:hypothetical protein [Clostridia bacterium]